MEKDKGLTYSKKLPLVTGLLFTAALVYGLICSNYENSTLCITAISVTGGVFAGTVLMYMRKAMRENIYKLDVASLKEKSAIELDHVEKVILIKKKYAVDDIEIEQIKYESSLDEACNEGYMSMRENIQSGKIEANESSEMDFAPKA